MINNITAVEWLESRIKVLIPEDIGSQLMFKSNIEKAKVMEEEQRREVYDNGYINGQMDLVTN